MFPGNNSFWEIRGSGNPEMGIWKWIQEPLGGHFYYIILHIIYYILYDFVYYSIFMFKVTFIVLFIIIILVTVSPEFF